MANRNPPHDRPKIGVAEDQIGGDDAIPEDLLLVIEVVEQEIEGGDPLDDPALDMLPFRCREHAWDRVERQDAVDRVGLGIDREGDPQIVERLLGADDAPLEIGRGHGGEPVV